MRELPKVLTVHFLDGVLESRAVERLQHGVSNLYDIVRRARLADQDRDLTDIARRCSWTTSSQRSAALAQSTYLHLAARTPLWLHDKEFEFATGPSWA